jgi:putative membrane protein
MVTLSAAERGRIVAALEEAERRTSAELVIVVAERSGQYAVFALLWAALGALLAGGAAALLSPDMTAEPLFAVEAATLVVLGAILHLAPLRHRLAPASVQRRFAETMARQQFAERVHRKTAARNGVLFFAALAERHVEILVDEGVAARIEAEQWRTIVNDFVAAIRMGTTEEGFLVAIGSAAALLEPHFPCEPGDRNEIADEIVEL